MECLRLASSKSQDSQSIASILCCCVGALTGVLDCANKSAASAASLVYVKFQAEWITALKFDFLPTLAAKKSLDSQTLLTFLGATTGHDQKACTAGLPTSAATKCSR